MTYRNKDTLGSRQNPVWSLQQTSNSEDLGYQTVLYLKGAGAVEELFECFCVELRYIYFPHRISDWFIEDWKLYKLNIIVTSCHFVCKRRQLNCKQNNKTAFNIWLRCLWQITQHFDYSIVCTKLKILLNFVLWCLHFLMHMKLMCLYKFSPTAHHLWYLKKNTNNSDLYLPKILFISVSFQKGQNVWYDMVSLYICHFLCLIKQEVNW